MKCLNCGEYISSNQTICSACGKMNIICPKCWNVVSENDDICNKCGYELIKKAKQSKLEKEKYKKEEEKRRLDEINQEKVKKEMEEHASNLIIDCEGNKFKAIKMFMENFNVEKDIAIEYIDRAYNEINGINLVEEKSIPNMNSIEEIVKRNNFQPIDAIREVKEVYGYDLITAKKEVDLVINNYKSQKKQNHFMEPKGIKRTIIVSQTSQKKATSAIGRGLVGGALLGPVGLLAGVSAKSKETTTFQVIYNNGTQKTETVPNDSSKFKEYCKYLDR